MKTFTKKSLSVILSVLMIISSFAFFGGSVNFGGLFLTADAATLTEGNYKYTVTDGEAAITGYVNELAGDIILPDTLGGYAVTSIGDGAFYDCTGLKSVTIGNSATSIGYRAFSGCTGLTSVTIPDSVTSIGREAFSGCTGLRSVTIGNSVTSIGSSAFRGCTGLRSVTIGNSVTSIGTSAFSGCKRLTSVTIPDSVTSIGERVFSECTGLTSVTIPDSVTSIGTSAFDSCKNLRSVTIPDSVTSIGSYAFYGCTDLTSVTIPDSVTSIENSVFNECTGLRSVTIPDSVTSIGGAAFENCSGLTSVTIPDSVTSIEEYAFWHCSGLTSVTIGNSVTSIGDFAFSYCAGLTSVSIPDSVTSIGWGAFEGCDGLKDVYYSGTEEQWNKISLGSFNDHLTDAAIHFNSTGPVITDPVTFTWSNDNSTCTAAKDGENVNAKVTSETIKEATCTEQGEIKYTATAVFSDGTTETDTKTVNIPALGHSWDNGKVTKQPTETEDGVKTFTCMRCGETKTEVIPSEKTKDETLNFDKVGGELVKSKDASEEYAVIYSQTDVNTLKNNLGGKSSYKITDVNGKEKTGGEAIATGDKINLNGRTYEIAVLGDITCDGKVNAQDARLALRYSARLEKLSGIQTEAAMVSKSEKVSASEARQILRYSAKLENKFGRQG